jgi:hypothetical protein
LILKKILHKRCIIKVRYLLEVEKMKEYNYIETDSDFTEGFIHALNVAAKDGWTPIWETYHNNDFKYFYVLLEREEAKK